MFKKALFCVLCFSLFSPLLFAEEKTNEQVENDYQYYALAPDIITNYIKPGNRIGYVRLTIELMTHSQINYNLVEKNAPLIRDKIITIFGEQNEKKVKSPLSRDAIRIRCLDEINALLLVETGKKPIEDLIFTKYLYQ